MSWRKAGCGEVYNSSIEGNSSDMTVPVDGDGKVYNSSIERGLDGPLYDSCFLSQSVITVSSAASSSDESSISFSLKD